MTFLLLKGTWDLGMDLIVLVPLMFLIPCANWPSLFANDFCYSFRSGPLIKWRYSWGMPVSGWMTAFASIPCIKLAARLYLLDCPPVYGRFRFGCSLYLVTLGGGSVLSWDTLVDGGMSSGSILELAFGYGML